jgi:hypothetical protein
VINGEYLVDRTEKFDVINGEYAKKRYCTKVINGEYIKKVAFIDDRNFTCKELANLFNKNLCKGNGERYFAFTRYNYNPSFYGLFNYKYLQIDDFELKYKDTNDNDNYFFDDDVFYVTEFGNWIYTIADTDHKFDFTIKNNPLFEFFNVNVGFCIDGDYTNGDMLYFLGIIKDKKNNKIYLIDENYAIEIKKYKEII